MNNDPIVDAVREARRKHAAQFNNDLTAIIKDLQEKEKKLNSPVLSLAPKLSLKKAV